MKMSITMMAIVGMGVMGYMYMKKHPEVLNKMMIMKKDMDNAICNALDKD